MAETFTHVPSVGFSRETTPKQFTVEFGDGYSQRTSSGINNIADSWELSFNSVSVASATSIVTFFNTHNGYKYFWWTPPGDSITYKVVCPSWGTSYQNHLARNVTCKFVRVYDLT